MSDRARRHAAKGSSEALPLPVPPLYDAADVDATVARFDGHAYGQRFTVLPGVRATFFDAGHLLGSAVTLLEVEEASGTTRLLYTGDLGRSGQPILRDPERPASPVDYLVSESTYGDRVHDAYPDLERRLAEILARAVERKGRVIIPAFSVGRTQNLVYHLNRLFRRGELPAVPIFVDSPLSVDATAVYRRHPDCYDDETRRFIENGNGEDPFGFKLLTYVRSAEESKALNEREGPFVIISSSGTCEHGRILHHLRNNVGRPENAIVFIGFQPRDTLGRRLVEGEKRVRIFGEPHRLRAEVVKLNGFSAHADRDELTRYAESLVGLRGAFLVHGEERASLALAEHFAGRGIPGVVVPQPGEEHEPGSRGR
jgi:metallo-beta-lactamase family protein